ncbi:MULTISPECIES: ABC transporter ATP-binding protein [Mesorhizobium]|uniref:ABC transporter ATP-binding protein n=2 Tax=Mesorhizobium TaxID=68287 RepID=A0A1A5JFD8_RHILI|nr:MULTISPECIES: ABC transporter ATP-binding protein [Mesorhizobium]ETA71683.1 ABC-type spermidine/putrescine transport system, ATPase component [Mesorhizobium japonicum R7A]MBE1708522.1 ABC transporter ATP-binding protein [Mesorhizobium japonicum]MBE1713691.1 ABC transporter ATP-binding protein [Mesorhizobium japonicum]MUT19841.1 ATP-binding cassette domain-containing protein [Mesorhizobium japonicum]MUT25811.1 ATP-binding cassette domain-containing protein [Mesorhizobium japonicum]
MSQNTDLLTLRSVSKSYGTVPVLHDIDLSIRDGEFLTVLGPSGSGKTTVLRLIGGLEPLTAGEIRLDGQDISRMPINKRPFNTVFQDYALFPHMTVSGNVGYGLSVRHVQRKEIARRVSEALELVQLGPFADRFPAQLSGGQRQRVALARALICQPRLILLDEPLAALDLELRRQMQEFLKSIQREIKTTFLFVTHDQEEAIGMADRICVMQAGHIRQLGTPHELYYKPNCEFVARFFGENNLVAGKLGPVQGEHRPIETALGRLICSISDQPHLKAAPDGASAFAAFRPEALHLADSMDGDNRLSGTIADLAFAGSSTVATITAGADTAAQRLRLRTPSRIDGSALRSGETVSLSFAPHEGHLVLA